MVVCQNLDTFGVLDVAVVPGFYVRVAAIGALVVPKHIGWATLNEQVIFETSAGSTFFLFTGTNANLHK